MKRSVQCYVRLATLLYGLTLKAVRGDDPSRPPLALPPGIVSAPEPSNSVARAEPARRSGGHLIRGLRWDNGLQYELGSSGRVSRAKDRHPDLDVQPWHGKVGFKGQCDAATYHTDTGLGDLSDDSGVRRARLYTSGGFFFVVPISYKAEAEIADQDFYIREAYLWFWEVPLIRTLKVGHFKAPMTMEGYAGSGDTLFLERASPVEAFGPGIMYGLQAGGMSAAKDATWALGWFGDGGESDISESSRSFTRAIGRVTWLPWCEEGQGPPKLLHLGTSAQFLYSDQSKVRYRSRPESYFAPRFVDTTDVDAQDAMSFGIEGAFVNGPWCLQSEVLDAIVSRQSDDLNFWGGYVAGSWLLTGESHPYNRTLACLARPTPRKPFSLRERHFGAWEAVSRFSHLDLNDAEVQGGDMNLVTLGLNGYLTSRLKVMFDYAWGRVAGGVQDGELRMAQGRVQYEF
jgi:phosphate-selective porin OprO/OprP